MRALTLPCCFSIVGGSGELAQVHSSFDIFMYVAGGG